MVPLIVFLTIAVFILVNVVTRLVMTSMAEKKALRERRQALDVGLRLEYTDEAKSLKRVEVEKPKARILAVDDEEIVLASFRKILVLDGYSIDTVETGPEAVGLVQKNDYDFVFTDLKMPDFDGLDVTKAVKHLRPDIDVVMITGYATIESAVEAMKHGAMDYVQKPFTEDELVEFVGKLSHRRAARLEEDMPPKLHVLTVASRGSEKPNVIDVARGVYVTPEHSWLGLEVTGELKIGVDDFCVKSLNQIDHIDLPRPAQKVKKGEALFTLHSNGNALTFTSPLNGEVSRVNSRLGDSPELLRRRPFQLGWICCVDAQGDYAEMRSWTLGSEALPWYEGELETYQATLEKLDSEREAGGEPQAEDSLHSKEDLHWDAFRSAFLAS